MPFVVDASITACWAFGDEEHRVASQAQAWVNEAHAPDLWWYEVRNALIAGERRGRITEAEVGSFLRHLGQLTITVDREPVEANLLGLARRYRLSIYDAAYLELASRLNMPLVTLDKALGTAAAAAGLPAF